VRGRRARHVAGQAGMASGFVGVTGRRHVKCGPDAGAPEAVERGGLDLHPRRLPAVRQTGGRLKLGHPRQGPGRADDSARL
jgi:hypothetical protein